MRQAEVHIYLNGEKMETHILLGLQDGVKSRVSRFQKKFQEILLN